MKKMIAVFVLSLLMLCPAACTNMNKTAQGGLSGAAGGALVGAGIGKLTGGSGGAGALIGGALGALAGTIYGNTQQQRDEAYQSDGYRGYSGN